jgi:hypothetical protein
VSLAIVVHNSAAASETSEVREAPSGQYFDPTTASRRCRSAQNPGRIGLALRHSFAMESPTEKMSPGYLATVVALMGVLPLVSILVELSSAGSAWELAFRWFVFWGVGARLLSGGVRQVVQPSFTAREIFHLASADAEVIVRELGFANICLGLAAAISGFVPSWRMGAAFAGGLYFGIAGAMHVAKRPATPNEWIALVSDLFIFAVVAAGFVHRLAT